MRPPLRFRTRVAILISIVIATFAAGTLTATAEEPAADPIQAEALPTSFTWSSSGVLAGPKPDSAHPNIAGLKDPSVVFHNGKWHVFASIASQAAGYNMVYFNFTDWSQASGATHHFLDRSAIGTGYRAAPQVFFYEPDGLWYLVYQTGNASYSTNPDISNPNGWTAPKHFYSGMPQIIEDNIDSGYWVDMWVTCDDVNCHLFSSDDNGHLYRSQTSVANFPNGMSEPVIALEEPVKYDLWEAANVYKIEGENRYLILVEAFGEAGRRYFRSWTAPSLAGPYTELAADLSNPFAAQSNVTFPGGQWTRDISHGEMIRTGIDQKLEISTCNMQYLYQGVDPASTQPYNNLPWRLGLLTQTNTPAGCDSGGGGDSGELRAVAAGKCLDVPNVSTQPGTQLQIWGCWGGVNQQWTLTAAGELTVYLGGDRRCLDAAGSGTANGTAATIWTCHGGANQKWKLNANGTITSVQSGLCLDVSNRSTADGAKVHLWSCHGGTNQQWTLG